MEAGGGGRKIRHAASVSECAHRFSPWVPCQIDLPKSSQQVGSPLVQRLQPRVFDAPLSGEPADDELAVAADGDRERVGARTDALQQVFQGGDHGAETQPGYSSCRYRTGPAARRWSHPARRSRNCRTPARDCQETRRRRRSCNRAGNAAYRLQARRHARSGWTRESAAPGSASALCRSRTRSISS